MEKGEGEEEKRELVPWDMIYATTEQKNKKRKANRIEQERLVKSSSFSKEEQRIWPNTCMDVCIEG